MAPYPKEIAPMDDDTYHGNPPGNCPDCKGTGHKYGTADAGCGSCPHCGGTGHVNEGA